MKVGFVGGRVSLPLAQQPSCDGVVSLVDETLRRAIECGASDVHFEPGAGILRVRLRVDGLLHDFDRWPAGLAANVIARLKVLGGLLTYRPDVPQEGSFTIAARGQTEALPTDVRVATFPTVRGERAAVRLLYGRPEASDLDDLGLSEATVVALRDATVQPSGLILVTGPAGAGKSTTLYALARHILEITPGRSVVSLEDPVEQRIDGMTQIQIQPYGELDYVRAMRSLLRQDVQVVLVGEIRDAPTAHIVVEASLTGHLIMSTMHSGDPAEAISRLLEMDIAPYQLVSGLTHVCTQRLVRLVCESCGGTGCTACVGSGYRGRTAVGQLAAMDDELREAVLGRAPVAKLRRIIHRRGGSLADAARRLVDRRQTTTEEVLRVVGATVESPTAVSADGNNGTDQAPDERRRGMTRCLGSNIRD